MKVILVVLLAVAAVSSATICSDLAGAIATATGGAFTEYQTISAVVDAAVGGLNQTSLWRYFDGTAGRSPVQVAPLRIKLIAWFAGALGCANGSDFTSVNQPVYSGQQLNLTSSHAGLGIGTRDATIFNVYVGTTLGVVLGSVGVDVTQEPVAGHITTIASALAGTIPQVTSGRTSICDKYSDTLSMATFVDANVNASLVNTYQLDTVGPNWAFWRFFVGNLVFPLVATNATFTNQLLPFFNGSRGTNFLAGTAYQTLLDKLAAFFGTATGCTDRDFISRRNARYANGVLPDLSTSHHPLGITQVQANLFNLAVASAAGGGSGLVSATDLAVVGGVLASLNAQIVAPPPTAPPVKASTPTAPVKAPSSSASGVAFSAFFVLAASFLALFF